MTDYYRDTDERMQHDAAFRALVHQMMAVAKEHCFTPGELKQAAFRAALELEMRTTAEKMRETMAADPHLATILKARRESGQPSTGKCHPRATCPECGGKEKPIAQMLKSYRCSTCMVDPKPEWLSSRAEYCQTDGGLLATRVGDNWVCFYTNHGRGIIRRQWHPNHPTTEPWQKDAAALWARVNGRPRSV